MAARQTGCKAAWELEDVPLIWINRYLIAAEAEAVAQNQTDKRPR